MGSMISSGGLSGRMWDCEMSAAVLVTATVSIWPGGSATGNRYDPLWSM